jgi:hypothetical protein
MGQEKDNGRMYCRVEMRNGILMIKRSRRK